MIFLVRFALFFTHLKLWLAAPNRNFKWAKIFVSFETKHLQILMFNPFKPEFTIVIFIHYKSRIAVAILDL